MTAFTTFGRTMWLSLALAGLMTAVPIAALAAVPTITLEQAVHFTAPTGEDVLVGPGTFEVAGTAQGLTLTPTGGTPAAALVIQAQPRPHAEKLEAATAVVDATGEDTLRVALLQPDGSGLEAVGSRSGI